MHKVEVDVVHLQALQRAGDALFDNMVPRVVELGGDPDLIARHPRVFDSQANFMLVSVR